MATVEFTGKDLTVRFEEEPRNGREFQYRIRYECANESVTHHVRAEGKEQYTKPDGMRGYKDVLTFEENLKAGLTRSPKVYLSTMDAGGKWSTEKQIDALNPAPDVPPMSYYNGYDMVAFRFTKPDDTDWAGFCVWADTQNPVRKDQITSKYIGPNNEASLSLLPDTDYWITYAAYDAFGTDLLNEATIQIHTLSEESILLPTLNERLEAIAALQVKSSTAFLKVASAYSNNNHRAIEELKTFVEEDGTLVSSKLLVLETRVGDAESVLQLEQQTRANADEALSQSILLQGARLGAAEAAIVSESTARATQDTALAQQLTQLAARVGTNEAQYSIDITNLVNKDAALSQRIDLQAAQWNADITAASQSIRTAFANADGALSQRIDTLTAQVGATGWTAALQTEQTARANADSALGQRIDTITAGYNGQFVTIQQTMTAQGNTISGLSAQYTLRIDNAGRVSGFGLASDPYGNSEFAVNVDRFLIAHPGSAERIFEVVSGQVRMRQAIVDRMRVKMAQIDNLFIGTNQIAVNAVTVTHFAQRTSPMYGNGTYYDALSFTVNAPYECDLNVWVSASQGFPNGDRTWNGRLLIDGSQKGAAGGAKTADTFSLAGYAHVGAGNHTILVRWQGSSSVTLSELKVMILETRR
ncbi:phage tail tip fiber protein [Sphingobium chungangianum]